MRPKESQTKGTATADRSHDSQDKVHPVGSGVGAAAGAMTGAAATRDAWNRVEQRTDASKNARLESDWNREWDQIYPAHSRPGTLQVPLQELHDVRCGRLDTAKFAEYLDRPLKQIANAMGKNYSAIHKTPAAPDVQPFLQSLKTSLVILEDVFGNRSAVLAWLNSPHPDLGQRTPLDVILLGHPNAVKNMLQAAIIGTPS